MELKKIRFDRSILKNVIRIGLPAGMQSVLYSVSNLVVQASINSFGTDAIASWAAIGKIDGFIWMVMSAFGIAITTFVGQNFGAQKFARVKKSIRVCLMMSLSTTIALSVLLLVFMEPLLRFFTGDETVIQIGQNFFWVLAPSYFTYVFIEILSGAIRGAGEAFQPLLITCFGVCGLRNPLVGAGGGGAPAPHHADGGYELPHHLGHRGHCVYHLLLPHELAAKMYPKSGFFSSGSAVNWCSRQKHIAFLKGLRYNNSQYVRTNSLFLDWRKRT